MKDNKKIAKVIAHLLEVHEDSRGYMDEFYKDCKNGEIEDIDWLVDDDSMDDWCSNQPVEYVRIYDYALLELSRRLLKKLDVEI
tara:strand:+ start:25 stop:276 length:252 start_codon:yes stop_codon:yes gene_type:complete